MANDVIRWSGLFLMAGAVLLGSAIVIIARNTVGNPPISTPASLLLLLSAVLPILTLPAMYARQMMGAGWVGLVGSILLQVETLLLVTTASTTLLFPSLHLSPSQNWVSFTLGPLLSGIATIRAGVFLRWIGILLIAATAGFIFTFFIAEFLPPMAGQLGSALFGALLAFALAWIGVSFMTGILEPAV